MPRKTLITKFLKTNLKLLSLDQRFVFSIPVCTGSLSWSTKAIACTAFLSFNFSGKSIRKHGFHSKNKSCTTFFYYWRNFCKSHFKGWNAYVLPVRNKHAFIVKPKWFLYININLKLMIYLAIKFDELPFDANKIKQNLQFRF